MVREFEIAIVGCGPAGLSAAVNVKRRNKSFRLFGTQVCSPKLKKSPLVENYLGFPAIKGEELRKRFLKHVEEMGIDIYRTRVDNVYPAESGFTLTAQNKVFNARAVIIATGVSQTKYLSGERSFLGKGVSYCATCDGMLYKGKTVALIAYTAEGEEEANFLSEICDTVYYLPLYKELGTLKGENIEIVNSKPKAIIGEESVTHLVVADKRLEVDGVFIVRGVTPEENLVPGLELAGEAIKVDRGMRTSIEGIFAAGDCTGRPHQLAKAVGKGQWLPLALLLILINFNRLLVTGPGLPLIVLPLISITGQTS